MISCCKLDLTKFFLFFSGSKSKDSGLDVDEPNTSVATRETSSPNSISHPQIPLAHSMLTAICDLLFCPEFTVAPNKNAARDEVDDLTSLDSCEYIWASGKLVQISNIACNDNETLNTLYSIPHVYYI